MCNVRIFPSGRLGHVSHRVCLFLEIELSFASGNVYDAIRNHRNCFLMESTKLFHQFSKRRRQVLSISIPLSPAGYTMWHGEGMTVAAFVSKSQFEDLMSLPAVFVYLHRFTGQTMRKLVVNPQTYSTHLVRAWHKTQTGFTFKIICNIVVRLGNQRCSFLSVVVLTNCELYFSRLEIVRTRCVSLEMSPRGTDWNLLQIRITSLDSQGRSAQT